ncbi:MAG TPA: [Fe-Fe] hydrogenase large subunit C-terminal domain-containing protein [Candidatus Hydrogenedentes bacterium]|nr:[Fe-Fe] hydrogenase large subunit C-terminal domain-containing protein [Candidatus Hydrogenedentota bacterium]
MTAATYPIISGDYERGGEASKQLKTLLKKIGADAAAVRRTMIAAYEAEMNVVIHAQDGAMHVAVDPEQVEIAVIDGGPGIPNIDRALSEGFSTAPAEARELGFGAGMGLPNIRRNSDRFSIHSGEGRGTQLRFMVRLRPAAPGVTAPNSVAIQDGRCNQCLRCLHACPTQATRVRGGKPLILEHLCVDCTACAEACPSNVFGFPGQTALPEISPETVLVLPASLLGQLGPGVSFADVEQALAELGFRNVRVSAAWENALAEAVRTHAADAAAAGPVLSPVCPAVVNLVRLRFPSLLPQVAPFLTPIEAARDEITGPHAVFVAPCSAQYTALAAPNGLTRTDVLAPAAIMPALLPRVKRRAHPPAAAEDATVTPLRIGGMDSVTRFLEDVENGQATDCRVVELYACPEGCFGAPIWKTHPALARARAEAALDGHEETGAAVRRIRDLTPRGGLRLDADMGRAMLKLGEIDRLTRTLPGRDCGVCGAPTCAALAEDTVRGETAVEACPYREMEDAGNKRRESLHES